MMFVSHTGNGQCPRDLRMPRYPRHFAECRVGFGTYNNGLRQFILNMFDTVFPGLFCWQETREESLNHTTVVSEMPPVCICSRRAGMISLRCGAKEQRSKQLLSGLQLICDSASEIKAWFSICFWLVNSKNKNNLIPRHPLHTVTSCDQLSIKI